MNEEEALKTAIVKSLGIVVRQIIRHPETGFTEMTILDIMSKVRARYGRMRKTTEASLEERMTTRLPSTIYRLVRYSRLEPARKPYNQQNRLTPFLLTIKWISSRPPSREMD